MKKEKELLQQVTVELVEGQEILKAEKKKLKKAKGALEKVNQKRAVKSIEQAVESLEAHRELLKSSLTKGEP